MATHAPFRLSEGIHIHREETKGNGLDKSIAFPRSIQEITKEYEAPSSGQRISPEALYKVHLPPGLESETPRTIKLIDKISHSLDFLSRALDAEDEVERESIMTSFSESIFELTFFPTKSKENKDAIFIIHTVIEAHKKDVYDRKEILTLQDVLNLVKTNLNMGDETLDRCVELLETAGFDVNAPIGDVELEL